MGYGDLDKLQTAPSGHHPKVFREARANPSTNVYVKQNYYLARLPIITKQIVVGTIMMGSTRRSKRPRPTESKEEASSSAPTKASKKLATRASSRNLNNCFEFGIPETLCCSSCQKYVEIDDRKRKNRKEYTHHSFQCWKPCKDDAQCLKKPRNKAWLQKLLDAWFASRDINRISSFVAEQENSMNATEMEVDPNNLTSVIQKTTNSGCPPAINMPDPLLVLEDDNPPHQELEPAQPPQPKPNKSIAIEDKTVQVQGKDHIIRDVPKTHVVIHRNYLNRLKNKESQIDCVDN
jgi:hypothetical protein